MAKNLNFDMIENEEDEVLSDKESAVSRWRSREPNPTVQMSIRLQASSYDQFRTLCKRERRTNGDMLEVMMKAYLASQK